jgi:hypothetical protein
VTTLPRAPEEATAPLPTALRSRNPIAWLTVFGPGAVIASLTIGVGELVFSARGGALFGYRLLWVFALVLVLKWVLVFASARHMVLSGAHPFQRWMELPGPRGWLPLTLLLLAAMAFPVWICFHAGTIGTLVSKLAGTETALNGSAHLVWGMGVLAVVLVLCWTGGYSALERVQLIIVLLMLSSVIMSLLLLRPDWLELLKGLLVPQPLNYPQWVTPETHAAIAARPVWVETTTYVGVIGGSSYDYLAYVSYLRDKHWGQAGGRVAEAGELDAMARELGHANRHWLRAPLADCTLSFILVLVFSAVFVACGAVVLAPQHQVPDGTNLLSLQAGFVTPALPWLKYVYLAGALLAVLGTLYGTIEVAPAVLREVALALNPVAAERQAVSLRRWAIGWCGVAALGLLLWLAGQRFLRGAAGSPALIALLTPANLFTGVLGCGLICLLNVWMDARWLPRGLRMNWPLTLLSLGAGLVFLALGFKGYWDHSGWAAFGILAATLVVGIVVAALVQGARTKRHGQ